ncbi:Uncharacterized protein OS=Pirellula staleyi (strain ATCC 27377 / DSM 6068 / ICPB 4128) GN=Psta_2333 PE=4 SV=1 [Gemmata massiliana]|uniref:DUF3108 domain-containing protein n=1 Tax=Gemmata massiliana TaxID=1210884 RepID=A0A6P2CY71_9BACT|nr:hypothetical protein [Gemmata massiliana]VTR93497.1 Uncharacterized protein OS=Pirellula staleyi (strain ATCC 27377 / DSM 6068 / ICPB 4128) GN=Psta_2333 PE=4 SV=1 [Gemmata massiliana]
MTRYLTFVALLTAAAPLAAEDKDALYFPTKQGTKLVYEVRRTAPSGGESTGALTDTIVTVETKGDAFRVLIVHSSGPGKSGNSLWEVSSKGLFAVPAKEGDPKAAELKLPAKDGDTWTTESKGAEGKTRTTTYKVGKEVVVEVPAGKFKTIPVETVVRDGDDVVRTTMNWYAPGVGLVKRSNKVNKLNTESVMVLKEIKPGK